MRLGWVGVVECCWWKERDVFKLGSAHSSSYMLACMDLALGTASEPVLAPGYIHVDRGASLALLSYSQRRRASSSTKLEFPQQLQTTHSSSYRVGVLMYLNREICKLPQMNLFRSSTKSRFTIHPHYYLFGHAVLLRNHAEPMILSTSGNYGRRSAATEPNMLRCSRIARREKRDKSMRRSLIIHVQLMRT